MYKESNPKEHYLIRDFILKQNGFNNYSNFLKSEYWQKIKQKSQLSKYRDNYKKCWICKTTENLQLHHENYRYLLTKDELRSIRCVCKTCHEKIHQKAYDLNINFYQAYNRVLSDYV